MYLKGKKEAEQGVKWTGQPQSLEKQTSSLSIPLSLYVIEAHGQKARPVIPNHGAVVPFGTF